VEATAIASSEGVKAIVVTIVGGGVAGSAYLLPNPLDQEYATIPGVPDCTTAIAVLE
jgi:hypothetical protein